MSSALAALIDSSSPSAKMSLPLGGGGGVRREDAVRFLDRVQQRLASRPQDYADFLNIMKVSGRTYADGEVLRLKMKQSFRSCKLKTSQWKVQLKRSTIYSRC